MRRIVILMGLVLIGCEQSEAERVSEASRVRAATAPMMRTHDGPAAELASEAFRHLMAPAGSELAIGINCGMGGPPRGLMMVRYLLAAQRVELLWEAHRSAASPEGRVWGAYGLMRAGGKQKAALHRFVAALEGSVWVCDGCLTFQVPAGKAVDYLPESA